MLKILTTRRQQGHRTIAWPEGGAPALPDRFRGRPAIAPGKCPDGCAGCAAVCPTGALTTGGKVAIDLGRCLFCAACARACSREAIRFTTEYRLAARTRRELIVDGTTGPPPVAAAAAIQKLFGRSLKLRQVSAGGCNACEADLHVLGTVVFDLGRFGIQFVASPRHADGLLVSGPVTENMKLALEKTYAAVPDPKLVIAVGSCAISGGPFVDLPDQHNGVDAILPVDLYIPGCPPHPLTILDALLRFLGRDLGSDLGSDRKFVK